MPETAIAVLPTLLDHGSCATHTDSHHYWAQNLGKTISCLMRSHSYSLDQVKRFQNFFNAHVAQALGEAHSYRIGEHGSKWTSFMCDDGSPVEIGLAWKAKDQTPHAQVRFAIEPVDDTEVRRRGTNFGATHTLIDQLYRSGHISSLGWQLFRIVDQALAPLNYHGDAGPSRTRYMIGFDLLRPNCMASPLVQVKAYFVLSALCSPQDDHEQIQPDSQLETVLEAIADLAPSPGFSQLKAYLQALPSPQRGRPLILSVDLEATDGSAPRSRVKVYWRFPDATPQSVQSHMDLGRRWSRPGDVGRTARQAWTSLMAPSASSLRSLDESSYYGSKHIDAFSSTGGSLFYFDLSWCASEVGNTQEKPAPSKAYIPVRHLHALTESSQHQRELVELEITRRCVELLAMTGRSQGASAYLASLEVFSCPRVLRDSPSHAAAVPGTHTYVCAEGSPDRPDICIYLKPRLL